MKKIITAILISAMILGLCCCGKPKETEPEYNASEKSEGVMSYAQYLAAGTGDSVTIEAFVQAHQIWHKDTVSIYAQDPDGGYFIYNMLCSESDAELLVPGTKIKVEGKKDEWQGEVRIIEGSFLAIEEGSWTAEAEDMTELVGTDALIEKQNVLGSFKNVIVSSKPRYRYDGAGMEGDDIYVDMSVNAKPCTFMVESYLYGKNSEVYKTVKNLKAGDKVDLEAFVYWFEEPNPHITSCTEAVEQAKGK